MGLWIVSVFAVICAGIVFFQKLICKRKSVNVFGYTSFIISSGSMQPRLQVNDIIVVKKVREGEISAGDIITFFDKNGDIITHRVAEISVKDGKTYYKTKGDANTVNDPDWLPYENIIGRCSFTIPGGGRIVAAVTSAAGITVFVLLLFLMGLHIIRKSNRKATRHSIREKYKQTFVPAEGTTP